MTGESQVEEPRTEAGRSARSYPQIERPVAGETSREAQWRRDRNRRALAAWHKWTDARCAECDQVRLHVSHEMDPATSPEGPDYHAGFAHHPFRESQVGARLTPPITALRQPQEAKDTRGEPR